MTPGAADDAGVRAAHPGSPWPGAAQATPPGMAVQRLVAVPWRHAGLIAGFALAGGLASAMFWPQRAPVRVAAAKPRMQAIQDAPAAPTAAIALRLDLNPGALAMTEATRSAQAMQASPARLRLDDASWADEIEAALRQAPPAGGRLGPVSPGLAPRGRGERPSPTLPGLVAGVLLGLLVAALRELGGQRMRSPREAQWALGAPVLGAIPTLSAKARDALLEPRRGAPGAA